MQSVHQVQQFSSDHLRVNVLFDRVKDSGELCSLGELLEYYRPMLERISIQRLGRQLNGKVSSSEVTQIALIKATWSIADFNGDSVEKFRAWLVAILEHEIADHARRFLVTQRRSVNREIPLTGDLEQHDDSPSQVCIAQEEIRRLLDAVEKLPFELRSIVRMRYQQDMTFAEIGAELLMPVATARRRWMEAVQLIEQWMA